MKRFPNGWGNTNFGLTVEQSDEHSHDLNKYQVRKYDYRPQHRHWLRLASLSGTASKHLKSAYLLRLHLSPFYHQGERKPCLPVVFLAFWKSQRLQRQLSACLHMHSHIFIIYVSPSLPCVCRQERVAVSISSYPLCMYIIVTQLFPGRWLTQAI